MPTDPVIDATIDAEADVDGSGSAWNSRAALRLATTDVHERLHRLPPFVQIEDGTIALDGYRALLARLYGFHAALDALFARRRDDLRRQGIDAGARAALLADDLDALGLSSATITALPRTRLSATSQSMAALLGVLYVREGSTLGGRVIARRLDPLFATRALPGDRGRRFFTGDGDSLPRWRTTLAALEAIDGRDPPARRDLIAGATACFADFERWMT